MSTDKHPKRLCSEIQLFEICSRENCRHKEGRFCTDEDVLAKFEAIQDEEDDSSDRIPVDELDDSGDDLDREYDDEYDADDYGDDEPEEDW